MEIGLWAKSLLLWFFGTGAAFFVGIGLLFISVVIRSRFQRGKWTDLLAVVLGVDGIVLLCLCATPLPWPYYALLAWVSWGWFRAEETQRRYWGLTQRTGRMAVIALGLVGIGWETWHQLSLHLAPGNCQRMAIIADSLTSGEFQGEFPRWPELLTREQRLRIDDLAVAGATLRSALEQVRELRDDVDLVLLEIGGNDILGPTTHTQFAHDLEVLLQRISRPGRKLVMCELPLPPFYNRYGVTLRSLCQKYQVHLIPRRVLMSVILPPRNTTDGIHLSRHGQRAMADALWPVLRPAFSTASQ